MELYARQYNESGGFLRNVKGLCLDILFPSFCAGCEKEGSFLCGACETRIVIKRYMEKPPKHVPVTRVYAALDYRVPIVSALVAQLKFGGVQSVHARLADYLLKHLRLVSFRPRKDVVIVPVPLHRARLAERGFNQSELIAKRVADALGMPFCAHALARIKNIAPQTEVAERKKRLENVRGAFACVRKQAIQNKTVVMVDDVMTTGATLGECARILKQAGAKKVIGCVVAR